MSDCAFSLSSQGLEYCITAPVQRTLFLDSQEAAISKSMIERRGGPGPDLKLDRLSEHEKVT